MRKTKIGKSVLTVILAIIMVFEMIAPVAIASLAAGVEIYSGGGAESAVADRDTSTKYSLSLGDNASTEYAGRIWTDKSVYTSDASFETFGGGTVTVKLNEGGELGEDFLVAYSALASSESISGQTQAPIDVVLIIDISGSMSNEESNMDNNKSRIYNTIQAANGAIEKLMALNEYTRVSVVAFSNNAQVLLPLDRYTKATTVEREWVQTGNGRWEGYWQETEVELPYFSLSRETASSNNATLYTNAVNSSGNTIERSTSVSGGTNIQIGLYEGMQVLAEEESTTANINGSEVQRVPSVILLSDGAPTYSSSSSSWWAPADNNNDGPGSAPYAGNGMKAILVGSYMKNAIDRNYGVAGTAFATTVYTVGMGITGLDTNEKNLAYMTLDPGAYWNNTNVTNSMKTAIKDYWEDYTANNNTGTLNINVGRYDDDDRDYEDDYYALTHPNTGYDVDPTDGYDYVDDYYDADNASAVTDVFNQIVSNISISAPQVPTEIKGSDPMSDGYITYTDPIGEYMQVKDVKSIIYAGTEFTAKTKNVSGDTTTYVFEGEVHSPVYGDQEIENILITVQKDANNNETLVVKIPASVIPLRVNEVTLNADGSVKSHINNGAYPARVIYSVGLRDGITKTADNGATYIDKEKISDEYLAANTNADGTINFYSNLFTNSNVVNGKTAGDTTVEFEPSHNNPFYYILEDMPIYKDADFTEQVTASEGLDDNTVYYYRDEYYHGTSVEVHAIERTGAQLKKTEIKTGTDGNLYRAAGSPRLNRILKFEGTKVENATGTAEDFYAPTFEYAQNSTDPYEGKFVVYQGNNGRVLFTAGGNLEITKEVIAGTGLTAPDKTFEFTLNLDGDDVNEGEYDYAIVDVSGAQISTGTVSKENNKISLKDGQTATVYSLPPETTYEISEAPVEGFTAQSVGAEGKIEANATASARFTNTYNVTPVAFPTNGELSGTKELVGRSWGDKDSFTFFISPYNNAPLPTGYNADAGVTVTAPDVADGSTASFNFGTIEFTAPGVYRYTIVEKEPENDEYLPGMSYSRALYRLVVTVEDNGDGTLSAASSDIQRLYDDGANPLFTYNDGEIVLNQGEEAEDSIKFTNTYSVKSVVRVPVALKDYTDNSGEKPLVSGMFNFKLEAVGYKVDNGSWVNDNTKVPMPSNSVNGATVTENEGHNVTFLPIEFTQDLIPNGAESITFRYNMSEVVPETKVYGMTYDTSVYTIDVVVSTDENSDILNVSAIYPNDERIVTFKNEYTPDPVAVSVNGSKTLIGRDMKSGEAFNFSIAAADSDTVAAVSAGTVVIPANTVSVKDGKESSAVDFAFNNIQIKKPGTYVFNLSENKGTAPAVEYDDSVVTVTVVVEDNNGVLEAEITYSGGKTKAEFVNTYTAEFEGTPVSLTGTKNLTGKTLLEGEFFFNVVEHFNGEKVNEGLVSHTADNEADENGVYTGAITFIENKTYSEAGTYKYYITEQIPTPKVGGTTYDESRYCYTVVVEDVEKVGKLTVTSTKLEKAEGDGWIAVNGVVFTNTYVPNPTTATLPLIKKVIAGERSAALKAGEFSFEIKKVSADPADGMTLPENAVVINNAEGNIVFDAITFTKPGTYTVSVTEIVPDDANKVAGITYSTQTIAATFEVVDDRSGNLTATLTQYVGGDAFINQYTATPGDVAIEIEKVLQGRDWQSTDKFEFEVVVLDPATKEAIENGEIVFPMDVANENIVTKTIDTEGETITGEILVKRAGTYKFIVREVTGTIPGIHYDSTPREITIVATDNSEKAEIDVVVTAMRGDEVDSTPTTLTFVNVYDASSTELSGHDELFVTKNFTGRENNEWLDTDFFVFKLETADITTETAVTNGDIELPADTLTVTNANKAHPHFGNIIFHKEGTYKFKVTEQKGDIPGVEYDLTPRVITVEVINDTEKAVLVAEVVADESDDLTFSNSYITDDVTVSGKTNLAITKSFVGRDWLAGDTFKFNITPYGSITSNAIADGYIVMPSSTEITIGKDSTDIDGGKTANFGDITFKKTGIYVFVISEAEENIDNVDYDAHHYYVTVTVTDNTEGQLVAKVDYSGSKVFVNTYIPDAVTVPVEGTKTLTGADRTLGANEFDFTILAKTPGAPLPPRTAIKNGANGAIHFGDISFHKEGTYVYEIAETNGNLPGIAYDTEKVQATVEVKYNSATGKLSAGISYTKADSTSASTFTFNNIYTPKEIDVPVVVSKKVTPSDGNSFALKGGEFKFTIEGTAGAPMPEKTTVSNDAGGKVDFGKITYSEAGTFVYTLRELAENIGGITYDGSLYTLTVTVTDDTSVAVLKADAKTTDADGKEVDIVFDNKYDPEETSAVIFGSKKLDGGYKELEADEFKFTISAVTSGAPLPKETTVTNTATGAFQFGEITYEKVGVYEYEITEENLGENGYTYDTASYKVTVNVTDKDGKLQATVDGLGTVENPTVKFVNSYEPKPVDVTLGADGKLTKALEGRELAAEEFEFILMDSEGNEVTTGKNDKDGEFKFTLKLTKADTYNYIIVEKDNELGGVTYDESVYGVSITVVDKGGYLEVSEVAYTLNDEAVENVVFNNTYKAEGTELILKAVKVLKGRDLEADEFTFTLKDENGQVISTATNAADGTVIFDAISYEEAGTYKYFVTEETGTADRVTYDSTEYAIEVTVEDDGEGKLVANQPVITKVNGGDATEISFENIYTPDTPEEPDEPDDTDEPNDTNEPTPSDNPKTGDYTNLGLLFALFFISGGILTGMTLCGKKRKNSEEN